MPRYWKHTHYAITNLRALVIVTLPGTRSVVIEYAPQEINELTSIVRANGSGTLTFGNPRTVSIPTHAPPMMRQSSFFGVADVQKVTGLLQELKAKNS